MRFRGNVRGNHCIALVAIDHGPLPMGLYTLDPASRISGPRHPFHLVKNSSVCTSPYSVHVKSTLTTGAGMRTTNPNRGERHEAPVLSTMIGAHSSTLQTPAAYVLSLPTLILQSESCDAPSNLVKKDLIYCGAKRISPIGPASIPLIHKGKSLRRAQQSTTMSCMLSIGYYCPVGGGCFRTTNTKGFKRQGKGLKVAHSGWTIQHVYLNRVDHTTTLQMP